MSSASEETKIIYYIDDDKVPYLIKLAKPVEQATLRDFKNALNDGRTFKYFFQAVVDDFGMVKEEISDEDAKLPHASGRVVSWLIPVEGSIVGSDTRSNHSFNAAQTNVVGQQAANGNDGTDQTSNRSGSRSSNTQLVPNDSADHKSGSFKTNGRRSSQRSSQDIYGVNKMLPPAPVPQPAKPAKHRSSRHSFRDEDTCSEIDSIIDSIDDIRIHRGGMDGSLSRRNKPQFNSFNNHIQHPKMAAKEIKRHAQPSFKSGGIHYADNETALTQSLASDFDTDTTFFDTEDDDAFSFITEKTENSLRQKYGQNRAKRRVKHKYDSHMRSTSSLHSSVSSSIDTTISVDVMTVTLNLDKANFLGISIVGQSNKSGEGGIYVSSIMNGGAVARDGRIEPGDMILQVNNVSFENLSNEEAVQALREAVVKPGPIKLVIAKCWMPNQNEKPVPPRNQDPIHPIDTRAWVAHTHAHMMDAKNKKFLGDTISSFGDDTTSLTSTYSDLTLGTTRQYGAGGTTVAESTVFNTQLDLTVDTDLETITQAMMNPTSGLDVRDRNWLKLTIPNAFTGSDVVDWLFLHVEGFPERRDAKKFAATLLKYGYIRHATHKMTFSEQCYYVFDHANSSQRTDSKLFTLNEESDFDFDSVSELENDTLYAPMAPMNCAPPGSYALSQGQAGVGLGPGQIYGQHTAPGKMYTNLNGIGIGGPPPPPSYISSSSSNATSNSTSTTSNNTTSQTVSTKASHMKQQTSGGAGGNYVVNSDRANACQFYYPPPSSQMTSMNSTNYTSSSANFTIGNNSSVGNYTNGGQPTNNTMTSMSSAGSLYRVAQNGQQRYEDQFNTITTINSSSVSSNQTLASQDLDASSVNTTRDENTTLNPYNSIAGDSRGNSFFQIQKPITTPVTIKAKKMAESGEPFSEHVFNKQQQQGPPGSAGAAMFKVPGVMARQKSSDKMTKAYNNEVFVDVM